MLNVLRDAPRIHLRCVAETDSDGASSGDQFAARIDRFHLANGVGDVDRSNVFAFQADRLAKTTLGDEINRSHSASTRSYGVGEPPR